MSRPGSCPSRLPGRHQQGLWSARANCRSGGGSGPAGDSIWTGLRRVGDRESNGYCRRRGLSGSRLRRGRRARARIECFQRFVAEFPGDRRPPGRRPGTLRPWSRRRGKGRVSDPASSAPGPPQPSRPAESRARNQCFQWLASEFPGERSGQTGRCRTMSSLLTLEHPKSKTQSANVVPAWATPNSNQPLTDVFCRAAGAACPTP